MLKIKYDGPANAEFEKKLTEFLKENGYVWYAQGTDLVTGIRDLAYDEVKAAESEKKNEE